MLLSLPNEVILKISGHLSFDDKLNLMTTCHCLNKLVLEKSLYEQLVIPKTREEDSEDLDNNIVKKFDNKQFNGNQVKTLTLHLDRLSDPLFYRLSNIFPNITRLVNYSGNKLTREHIPSMDLFAKWKDSYEYYSMYDGHFEIPYLLEKNVFSRLVYLCISPFYEIGDTIHASGVQIIECIKNAPSLMQLVLNKCMVNIEFLEIVHHSCPQLYSLKLEDTLVATSDDALPQHLVPCTSLHYLDINKSTLICDTNSAFLDYIIAKYTNLQEFDFFPSFNRSLLNGFFPNQSQDRRNNNPVYLTLNNDLDMTSRAYLKESARLLSRLPRSLNALRMFTQIFDNIIEALEKSDINPEILVFLENNHYADLFQNPKQFEYLKRLTRLKSLEVSLNESLQSSNFISSSLTVLNITIEGDSPDKKMNLFWLLNLFPSLEELCIRYSGATLVGERTGEDIHRNLKKITFGRSATESDLLPSLCTFAPRIKEISWCIFGNAIKKSLEKERWMKPICITPNTPLTTDTPGQQRHQVDLSGYYSLDTFQLWIQLGEAMLDIKCKILFEVKMKRKTKKFIFSDNFTQVSVVRDKINSNNEDLEEAMTTVTVVCNGLNQIKINHAICIDLKESKIYMNHV